MRQPTDALRSVVRQMDLILNDGPATLAEVWTGPLGGPPTHRWTHLGMAPGALEVSESAWTWLTQSQLAPAESVVDGARRWETRRLIFDPTVQEMSDNGLPTAGAAVAEPSSLPEGPSDPWEVRFAAERGSVGFPFCRVQFTTAPVISGSARFYEITQPMLVEAYPQEQAADAERGILAATDLIGVLLRGVRGEGVGDGRPMRIPLYDYDGVDIDSGVSQRRLPHDFLWLEDFAPRTLPDAADPRRVAVVADMRVKWRVSVSHRTGQLAVDSLGLVTAGS